jgi:hypothetical protein
MATFDYVQLPKVVGPNKTGFNDNIWFAPRSWFNVLQARASGVTITATHTFTSGKGFIKAKMSEDTVELVGESIGDTADSRNQKLTLKAFRPGLIAENIQLAEEIRNDDVIILLQDCNGLTYQLGSDCAEMTGFGTPESGKKSGGKKGYNYEFSGYGDVSVYTGTITLK